MNLAASYVHDSPEVVGRLPVEAFLCLSVKGLITTSSQKVAMGPHWASYVTVFTQWAFNNTAISSSLCSLENLIRSFLINKQEAQDWLCT